MIRLVVYFLLLVALTWGVTLLADNPGSITIDWLGYELQGLSIGVALTILLLVFALLWFVISLFLRLVGTPGAISGFFARRRQRKGLEAISGGLLASGSGDVVAARKFAAQAERLMGQTPLAKLLKAEAAQLAGDKDAVKSAYKRMLDDPETELAALRGLYDHAVAAGQLEVARELAERAHQRHSGLGWAARAVGLGLAQDGDWPAVAANLEAQRKAGLISRAQTERRRAVVLAAQALEIESRDPEAALDLAIKAHRLENGLVPAALVAARVWSSQGQLRKAVKILETCWALTPHPDIADQYAHARAGDSAQDRLQRIRNLLRKSNGGDEGVIALANAAIDAGDWAAARKALKPLLENKATVRSFLLMAEIEEQEFGDKGRAREWLARAARAPRDPAWTADGHISPIWLPMSPVTGELGAFEWKAPIARIGFDDDSVDDLLNAPPVETVMDAAIEDEAETAKDVTPSEPVADSGSGDDGADEGEAVNEDEAASLDDSGTDDDAIRQVASNGHEAEPAITQTGIADEPEAAPPMATGRQPDDPGPAKTDTDKSKRWFN